MRMRKDMVVQKNQCEKNGNMRQNNNKYMRLLSDTGIFAVGNLLVKIIQFALLPLYTSALSTQAYGTGELLNNLSEFLFPIVTFALYEAVFRFAVDPDDERRDIINEAFILILKTFSVLIVVAAIVRFITNYEYIFYLIFVLFAYSVRMLFAYYARGCGYAKCFAISGVVNSLALAFLSWIFIGLLRLDVQGYLLALATGHLFSALVLMIGAHIPSCISLTRRNRALLSKMLTYSVPLIFNSMAWWLTSISNRYIVLFSYGASVAGLYTAANKLPAVISMVAQIFRQSWQLNSAREIDTSDRASYYENVLKVYFIVILLATSIAICSSSLLSYFTLKNEFHEARHYIPIMMLAVCVHCFGAYYESILFALKDSRIIMRGMLLGAVVNVVLALALVRPFGVWGVLIASVVCYLVILAHRTYSVGKHMKIDKNLPLNFPLFFILCVQTGLMSIGSKSCVTISIILLALMILLSAFSFRRDIKLLLVACRSCKK